MTRVRSIWLDVSDKLLNGVLPYHTLDDLIAEIRQYPPGDLLPRVRRMADEVKAAGPPGLRITLPHELRSGLWTEILVAPYLLALVARLSLLVGERLAPGSIDDVRFLRILAMGCDLYDPSTRGKAAQLIFKTMYEQAPYQESVWQSIPRALLLYEEAGSLVNDEQFGIVREFEALTGITIRDFLMLGFALFSQMMTDPVLYPLGGWHSKEPVLNALLTTEKKRRLLQLVAADQTRFRRLNEEMGYSASKPGRYEFNALFRYPVADLGSGKCVVPLMDLLAMRLYDAPFHEIADRHRTTEGNAFRTYFGRVFQEYVGLLLKDAFDPAVVVPEAGPNPPGPVDWLVRLGNAVALVECRTSDFSVTTKASGDMSLIESDLKRIAQQTVAKLPEKQTAIMAAADEMDLGDVSRCHLLVVTKEPLLPVPMIRGMINEQLPGPIAYHLLSVDDFEQLIALQDVDSILSEKAEAEEIDKDFRTFFFERRSRYQFRRNPLLDRTFDEYFAQFGIASDQT